MKPNTNRLTKIFTAISAFLLATGASQAAISVLGTGSAVTAANSGPGEFTLSAQGPGNRDGIYSYAFAAGATSDMLVVALGYETSSESGWTVSYNGVGMNLATQSSVASGTSIFYLANPSATGSIAIDFTGKATVNGIGLGVVSLNNSGQPIYFNNGVSDSPSTTVAITVGIPDSFVMFAGDSNATTGTPTLNSPLTSVRASWPGDIGSNQAVAGYQNEVAAGDYTYSYNMGAAIDANGNPAQRGISVAAFSAIPEPSTALLGCLGMLALLRRRRA